MPELGADERNIIPGESDRPLPPPGDARREEMGRRTDELQELAEKQERVAIDPESLKVDPELARHFNDLDVTEKDSLYDYCWVFSGQHGTFIKRKLAQKWEVVTGDMPEARELMDVGGLRRLGDVILMRIRKDNHARLLLHDRDMRRRQQRAVDSRLKELGEKAGIKVHADGEVPDRILKSMEGRSTATRIVQNKMDQLIKEGRVPGTPAPGTRGSGGRR